MGKRVQGIPGLTHGTRQVVGALLTTCQQSAAGEALAGIRSQSIHTEAGLAGRARSVVRAGETTRQEGGTRLADSGRVFGVAGLAVALVVGRVQYVEAGRTAHLADGA